MNGKHDALIAEAEEAALDWQDCDNSEEADLLHRLAATLATQPDRVAEMEARKDAAYLERNQVVAALASVFPSGTARTAIEGWSDDWHGCVYIDLPTGQVSWHYHDSQAHLFAHLPPYQGSWDGHDTEEKYRRVLALRGQSDRYREGFERAREMAAEVAEEKAKWLRGLWNIERQSKMLNEATGADMAATAIRDMEMPNDPR